MEFKDGKAIYLQIVDYISEKIIKKKWKEGDRMVSVREFAIEIEVNPNTVMRAYSYLQDEGIIYNKRGIGYFIGDNSMEKVLKLKKENFVRVELPGFFKAIDMLNIDFETIKKKYEQYKLEGVVE